MIRYTNLKPIVQLPESIKFEQTENFSRYPNLHNQIKNILKDGNTLDIQNLSHIDAQITKLCICEVLPDKILSDVTCRFLTSANDGYQFFNLLGGLLDEQQKTYIIKTLPGKILFDVNNYNLTSANNGYYFYTSIGGILDEHQKSDIIKILPDKILSDVNSGYLISANNGYHLYTSIGGILNEQQKSDIIKILLNKILPDVNRGYLTSANNGYQLFTLLGGILDEQQKSDILKILPDKVLSKVKDESLTSANDGYQLFTLLGGMLDEQQKIDIMNMLPDAIVSDVMNRFLTSANDGYQLFNLLGGKLDEQQKSDIIMILPDKILSDVNSGYLTSANHGYDLQLQILGDIPINKNLEAYFELNKSQIMKYRDFSPQSIFDLEYIEQLTSQFPLLLKKPDVYKPLLEKNYDLIKSNFENTYIRGLGKKNNGLWKLIDETIWRFNNADTFLYLQKKYFSNVTLESIDDDCIQDIINYSLEHDFYDMVTTYKTWLGVFGENIFDRKQLNLMYISSLKFGEPIPDFPRNHDSILDHLEDNEVLLEIPKDRGFIQSPKPWSKEWFLEKCERVRYLNSDDIQTFLKFGTVVALGILEGSTSLEGFQNYYDSQLRLMNVSDERSIILQLGEILNVIVTKQNFAILNDISDFKLGDACKEFIDKFGIGHKGKTIISLLFTNEINATKQIQGDCSLKNISNIAYHKIQGYNEILKGYDHIPEGFRISLGLEYEVTISISDEYHTRTHSDYKQDIEILSEYSGIAKGNDAIHEIATKPTDNPYLLILELSLLQSLDFINLNFDMKGYERGSRGFHISVGGEYGIQNNGYTNFMQNILIAANLGGINAGKSVKKVNTYSNIREKGSDCDAVFSNNKTPVTELRSLSIDTAESFERCMVYLFDMSLGNQALKKLTTLHENDIMKITKKFQTKDDWKQYLVTNNFLVHNNGIYDEQGLHYAFHFFCLMQDVIAIIQDHNDNFYTNETDGYLRDTVRSTEHTLYRDNKKMFGNLLDIEDTNELVELIDRKTRISPDSFFQVVTPEFQNTFTFINNLYLKGADSKGNNSSVNAGAVFDCTKIQNDNGSSYYDSQPKACRKTVFDHLEEGMSVRSGRYQIQGSSDKMIVNALQEALIKYHNDIKLSFGS